MSIALKYTGIDMPPVAGTDDRLQSALGLAVADFYDANAGKRVPPAVQMAVVMACALEICLFVARRTGIPKGEFPDLVRDIAGYVAEPSRSKYIAEIAAHG